MSDLRNAALTAMEALEESIDVPCYGGHPKQEAAAATLRAALEEPQNCAECSRWQRAVLEQGEVIEQLKSELGQSDPTPKPLNGLSQEQPKQDTAVHMAHCNQGEHTGACKYGEEACPALAQEEQMLNGLIEAETLATASVEGLARPEPEPEQKPVAWRIGKSYWSHYFAIPSALLPPANTPEPLYTHPPRREWQSLTEEEIDGIGKRLNATTGINLTGYACKVARAIEVKLKEKNSG